MDSINIKAHIEGRDTNENVGFALRAEEIIKGNYRVSVENVKASLDYQKILDAIKAFRDFKITNITEFYTITRHKYKHADCLVFVEKNSSNELSIDFYARTDEILNEFQDTVLSLRKRPHADYSIDLFRLYYNRNQEIKTHDITNEMSDYEYLDADYYPFLDLDLMFTQFLFSKSNILLLYGEPGVGKSKMAEYYMKFLLGLDLNKYSKLGVESLVFRDEDQKLDKTYKVFTVKNEKILADETLWSMIAEGKPNLVIFDDLDFLLPRSEASDGIDLERNQFMSYFLSSTDGINTQGTFRTKFIITTNRNFKEIDEALLRRGRTFEILNLRKLTNTEAKRIWKKHLDSKFNIKDEFISQCDLASLIDDKKMSEIYSRDYLKEPDISHLERLKEPRLIGF